MMGARWPGLPTGRELPGQIFGGEADISMGGETGFTWAAAMASGLRDTTNSLAAPHSTVPPAPTTTAAPVDVAGTALSASKFIALRSASEACFDPRADQPAC